jgi:hypothetical protein
MLFCLFVCSRQWSSLVCVVDKLLLARAKKKFNKVVFVALALVFCNRLVVPCDGFFVVIRLLPHDSRLCQAAAREGEEKIQ